MGEFELVMSIGLIELDIVYHVCGVVTRVTSCTRRLLRYTLVFTYLALLISAKSVAREIAVRSVQPLLGFFSFLCIRLSSISRFRETIQQYLP